MPSPPKGGYGVQGRVAEWLGSGLQNHVQRFDSARDLNEILSAIRTGDFLCTDGSQVYLSEQQCMKNRGCLKSVKTRHSVLSEAFS